MGAMQMWYSLGEMVGSQSGIMVGNMLEREGKKKKPKQKTMRGCIQSQKGKAKMLG